GSRQESSNQRRRLGRRQSISHSFGRTLVESLRALHRRRRTEASRSTASASRSCAARQCTGTLRRVVSLPRISRTRGPFWGADVSTRAANQSRHAATSHFQI